MKFKLDKNLPLELADDLVLLGHEADTVNSEGLKGANDLTVIQAAQASERILMTLDKGIASMLRYPVHEQSGTVLVPPGRIWPPICSVFCSRSPQAPAGA